jgi:protein-S-isoprenylcysteine O-methyltransferase Ste14
MFWEAFFAFASAAALEAALIVLQRRNGLLGRWLGKTAFWVFAFLVSAAWATAIAFFAALQLQPSPNIPYNGTLLQLSGLAAILLGAPLSASAFLALGWRRTYNIRFFEEGWDGEIRRFPYSVLRDPMYIGGALILFGMAFMLDSAYDLAIAFEVALLMLAIGRAESGGIIPSQGKKAGRP